MSSSLRLLMMIAVRAAPLAALADDFDPRLPQLSDLPPHLRFEQGKLSLVADYATAQDSGGVLIYIVNATGAAKSVGYRTLVMRETLADDGKWHRCDWYSPPQCGVGLDRILILPPDTFCLAGGTLNSLKGERRKVRFRHYEPHGATDWISNEGFGIVDPAEVEACRFDSIGIQNRSFEELALLIMQKSGHQHADVHSLPIALGRVGLAQDAPNRVKLLKEILAFGKAKQDIEVYGAALRGLRNPSPPEWTEDAYWRLVTEEARTGAEPWTSIAFAFIMEGEQFPQRKRALIEEILDTPRHPRMLYAMRVYPRLAGHDATKKMVDQILRSPRYRDAVKAAARDLQEKLRVNPYVGVHVVYGEAEPGRVPPLQISIVNASDKPISLRSDRPEDLLIVTGTGPDGRNVPPRTRPGPKAARSKSTIRLGPREAYHFDSVKWWEHLDLTRTPRGTALNLSVSVKTPGLWDVPSVSQPLPFPAAAVDAVRE